MLSEWNTSNSMHFTLAARRNLETSISFVQPEAAVPVGFRQPQKIPKTEGIGENSRARLLAYPVRTTSRCRTQLFNAHASFVSPGVVR